MKMKKVISVVLACACAVSYTHLDVYKRQVLYLGIVSTTITYLLQTVSQKYVDETKSAIILSMEAVFGTIFSVILLHETVTVRMITGSVLILAAVLVSEVSFSKKTNK